MANISKRTPKREQIILDSLRVSPVYAHACAAAGISFATLLRWMREDEDWKRHVEDARTEGGAALEDELVQRATSGDTTALIFALKAWNRAKYGDKQQLEHTGKDGSPLIVMFGVDEQGPS